MTDFRALCAELAAELDHNRRCLLDDATLTHPLADRARYLLAEPVAEPPAPPAEGEVAELVNMLTGIAYWKCHGKPGERDPSPFDIRQADRLTRAAELLERHAAPVPVPVSDRHPGAEDCDHTGRCWWFDPHNGGSWDYSSFDWTCSHWLPAGALPRPGVQP